MTLAVTCHILHHVLKTLCMSNVVLVIQKVVTLASPKFLALGNAKEKQVFLLHFTRYFVTLPRNVKT